MFPPLYFCRLFICYVDTHVESHATKINSVAICSRSKFNLTGLMVSLVSHENGHDISYSIKITLNGIAIIKHMIF